MNSAIEIVEIKLDYSNQLIDELRSRIEKLEEENLKTNNKDIKKRSRQLLELSTCHGMPNIVRTQNLFILIMWSFFTVASTCFCSYFVIKAILDYLKNSTITNIQVISENQAQFPTISFCGLPSFNNITLNQTIVISIFDTITDTDINQYYEEYNDSIMRKCFRFNSGKNIYNNSFDIRNSTKTGFENGFKLHLRLTIPDEYNFGEAYVFIHNHSSPPFDTFNGRGFWLITGTMNYFELDRVYHQKLDAPYNDCLRDVNSFQMNKTLIDYILKQNREYSQSDCFYLCSNLFAMEERNCNCKSTYYKYI
jgi:hypothetical protein